MSVMNVTRFEHFFRRAASLDIDKADLRRFDELVNRKVYDLLLRLEDVLDQLTKYPILDLAYSDDTQRMLPKISGGIGVALARSFKILDPQVKNPQSEHWERASRIFDLLL
jgi:hypothetical protein